MGKEALLHLLIPEIHARIPKKKAGWNFNTWGSDPE
jgi:hypothetical protein